MERWREKERELKRLEKEKETEDKRSKRSGGQEPAQDEGEGGGGCLPEVQEAEESQRLLEEREDEDIALRERVALLQRTVAELEVDQQRLTARSCELKDHNQRLRSHRKELRHRLRMIGEPDGEEQRLKIRIKELEEQASHLRLTLLLDSEDKADFIEQSTKNNQSLLSLRRDLSQSLDVVSRKPLPSVLQTETQRLDQSLREELRMSLSQ